MIGHHATNHKIGDRTENQDAEGSTLEQYAGAFRRALSSCERIWGNNAFRRPTGEMTWRDQTLAGMYDAQMVAVDSLSESELSSAIGRSGAIQKRTSQLFLSDADLEKAVRTATNTPSSVRYRIGKVQEILRGVG